jgi:hypothetical protein
MGTVFLAESPAGARVAVKVVRPELSADAEFRARFRSEMKRARQVPGFCTAEVLDADADADPPYLVVEYVPGPSLADVVHDSGPLRGGDLHSVAIGVIVALVAIHDAGVVHRDLKPANVLFASLGTPKVIDFGVATALTSTEPHTGPGQIMGTVAYMGPERLDGTANRGAGAAGDIWAWGALVHYAATGQTPYDPETLIAVAAGMPLPAPDLTSIPLPLRGILKRALHRDPAHRPSAHEVLEWLVTKGSSPLVPSRPDLVRAAAAVRHTEPVTPVGPRPAWARRRTPRLAAAAAVLLIAAAAGYPLVVHSPAGSAPAAAPDLGERERTSDKASRAQRDDRCTLTGPLDVQAGHAYAFTCPAARNAGDQSIRAKISLAARSACALISTDTYRTTVCADQVVVTRDARTVAMSAVDPAWRPGVWHQVEIRTPGSGMTVALDGDDVINRSRLSTPGRGAVSLGSGRGPGPVSFAEVEIASVG